jgi:hypothetical protein
VVNEPDLSSFYTGVNCSLWKIFVSDGSSVAINNKSLSDPISERGVYAAFT